MTLRQALFGSGSPSSASYDLGVLALRLMAGLGMALAHGLAKTPPPERLIEGVTGMGFPLPVLFA